MKVQESLENYLEAILMLSEKQERVRAIDIANLLGFSKPSVSVAMKNFKQKNYIHVDDSGSITLTESGKRIASAVYERHNLLSEWLVSLGVEEQIAQADACRMEHILSAESFQAIRDHYLHK
ncbi:metal-dependent transcriptional regulator [Massilicoli timonensis]|uniref:iron dependent repressor, metal binding and dimerization domain protein n=1 Tax=Massilicoli timonensis TaxID=2015901 RepID=UPI000C8394BD|nr:metal-dependent transcriptional regulator [Candidatus Onthosoma merdavium]